MKSKSFEALNKEILVLLHGNSSRERFLHRLHSLALVLNGLSASQVGQMYNDSPRAVAYWLKRFKQKGVAGLYEESRPGRPSKLSLSQMRTLQRVVKRWRDKSIPATAKAIAEYLKEKHGIRLTVRQCWRILKRLKT